MFVFEGLDIVKIIGLLLILISSSLALAYIMSCGVAVLATANGGKIGDIKRKPGMENVPFERYVLLGERPGNIIGVYDENLSEVV